MKYAIVFLLSALSFSTFAQDKVLTLEDAVLSYSKGLTPERLNNLQWAGSSNAYSYIEDGKLVIVDRISKEKQILEPIMLASDLESFPAVKWLNEKSFRYKEGSEYKSFNIVTKISESIASYPNGASNLDLNTENEMVAYTIDNDLYISSNDKIDTIVNNEDPNIVSGQAIARYEFGIGKGTFWSTNGRYLAFYEKDETNVWDYPLLDISTTPGSLKSVKYPMAGQKSEIATVGIYDTKKGDVVYLSNSKLDDHYYTNVSWGPKDIYLYVQEVNRDQNHMWLNKYKSINGEFVETLYEEVNDAWVEPEHPIEFYDNTKYLQFSEKDGFMNLYRYKKNGYNEKQLTKGFGEMHSIIGYTKSKKTVFIQGTGKDPKDRHIFKVNIRTGKTNQLTDKSGSHSGKVSPDGNFILDSYSSLDTPFEVNIIDTEKYTAENIFSSSNPLVDHKIGTVEFLKVKTDGYDLHARIIKPSDFDSNKKYPVLVYVYGGPHAQMVTNRWGGGASLWMRWMAEQGYIIFTLDNRGSANLGFAMESQIHRQIGTVEMEDQMIGVEYLKGLPYVDGDRLAVHGWSYGGFMTMSLMMRQAGTFNVGVAGGPVVDWKWYEIMYGERYMDTPEQNPEGYQNNSLLNYPDKLEGKLLTIHGGVDDVVVMQHNLGFLRACVEQGVQTDFYTYPTHPHNVRGKDRVHLMTKVLNYVMENNK